jgi:GntR family transcriptional regulator / MocR family aminotransferase
MAVLLPVAIDADSAEPLHRQVYRELARLILAGRLTAGSRLPSSRELARELGVARNTVLAALDQLTSEGYIEGRRGSGTYVATDLPDAPPVMPEGGMVKGAARPPAKPRRFPPLAAHAAALADGRHAPARLTGLLAPGVGDAGEFPFELWARLLAKSWRRPSQALAAGGAPGGYMPLRKAIADYLRLLRGVRCEAEQVIVVSGTRQGLDLVGRLLLTAGDQVWLEDPGYPGLRGPLAAAGARLVPLPVDGEGIDLSQAPRAGRPRLIAVTPSHQYPLGMTMSLGRRLQLLERARQADAWIFEDDYDSEWRYRGRPLAALQGLDSDGRVIYAGSFSKVLFASLRIGYLVVPPQALEAFLSARSTLDDQPSLIAQPALAAFLAEGHFAAYLRRQRRIYRARQEMALAAAEKHLGGLLDVPPDPGGLHLVGFLTPELAGRMDDHGASRRAEAVGISVPPLSKYWIGRVGRQGLMLGYAAMAEGLIEPTMARLARALECGEPARSARNQLSPSRVP